MVAEPNISYFKKPTILFAESNSPYVERNITSNFDNFRNRKNGNKKQYEFFS